MTINSVMEKAREIIEVKQQDENRFALSCKAGQSYIEQRLNSSAPKENEDITFAAAAVAVYIFCFMTSTAKGDEMTFKAGDLSVTRNEKEYVGYLKNLKDIALDTIRQYLQDDFSISTI